jgi:hypothetical protein
VVIGDEKGLELSTLAIEYTVDRRYSDNRVHVYIGIDLKEEYKKRVDTTDTVDKGWTG